ncbi:MAG: iron-sulfur cluster assembly protein, partial [Planctomycetota bacterium]
MSEQTDDRAALRERIIAALRTVKDPELPINLYDLGLIYDLDIADGSAVRIRMTLTTPNCPVAESMPAQVQRAVEGVEGVDTVSVELVWDP